MKTKQAEFTLSAKDRAELEKIVGDGNAAQKVAKRAKIGCSVPPPPGHSS
jgi:hypothetical protein